MTATRRDTRGDDPHGRRAPGNQGLQSVVDFIAGVDTTQYATSGGDSGRPDPASVTAARRALEFNLGGWLPRGFSTVDDGLGRPEPLARLDSPEQLPNDAGRGFTGFIDNGTVIAQDLDGSTRKQRIETRRITHIRTLP